MAENSQSQKAGEGSTLIQSGGNVTVIMGVSYGELDRRISDLRKEVAQEVLSWAQAMIKECNLQPKAIPLKILVPLLQYASLEEGADLQERWAALLANTALGSPSITFSEILHHLSSTDAQFSDYIYDQGSHNRGKGGLGTIDSLFQDFINAGLTTDYKPNIPFRDQKREQLSLIEDWRTFRFTLDNLLRLGILTRESVAVPISLPPEHPDERFEVDVDTHEMYSLTILGTRFITACRCPKARP